jgi:hypothetical protein
VTVKFLAVVGFNPEPLWAVSEFLGAASERISENLASVKLPTLPNGIAAVVYFERKPTGRQAVHFRYDQKQHCLLVRLDVVAPSPDASLGEVLQILSLTWAAMLGRLERYLLRRGIAQSVSRSVVQACSLTPLAVESDA